MGRVRKLTDSERKSIVSMFPQLGVTETARRAGMDCISVAWGFRDEDMLRAEGASCIVHSAEELFDALK